MQIVLHSDSFVLNIEHISSLEAAKDGSADVTAIRMSNGSVYYLAQPLAAVVREVAQAYEQTRLLAFT